MDGRRVDGRIDAGDDESPAEDHFIEFHPDIYVDLARDHPRSRRQRNGHTAVLGRIFRRVGNASSRTVSATETSGGLSRS